MSVTKFLRESADKGRGGAPCLTCRLKQRQRVEKAVRQYLKERDAERTFMPWRTFITGYVQSELKYPYCDRALAAHMEKCLGIKTK